MAWVFLVKYFWWMSLNLSNDKSTLIQVMAWCHRATSHYLSQCWPNVDPDLCHPMASLGHKKLVHRLSASSNYFKSIWYKYFKIITSFSSRSVCVEDNIFSFSGFLQPWVFPEPHWSDGLALLWAHAATSGGLAQTVWYWRSGASSDVML